MSLRLLLLLGVLVAVVAVSPPAAGAAPDTVRVVFQAFQTYGALFIAEKEGFFGAEGIRIHWVTVRTSAEGIALLSQEQLDVGAGGVSPAFFNGISRGLQVRIVADKGYVGSRGGAPVVMVRRGLAGTVKTVPDLRGRRVAISGPGDLGHYLWHRILTKHGLALSQVTLTILPLPAYLTALEGGGIDAALLNPPLDSAAAEADIAYPLADVETVVPGEPLAFLFYGPSFLERNRPLGVRFMSAYLRALRRYNDGPTARNVATITEYTKVEPALVRRSGWIGMRPDGLVDVAKVRRLQDWMFEVELVTVRNPMQVTVDHSFLERAAAALELRGIR